MRRDLVETLRAVAPALALARHPWWILGSAAVALHGADPGDVRDVDILLDSRDCPAVFASLGIAIAAGQADSRFRSALFQQWLGGYLPVELFAGFAVLEQKTWQQVVLRSRQAIPVADFTVFVPEKAELITIMHRFGRPKDLGRIAALSPSGPSPSRSESA